MVTTVETSLFMNVALGEGGRVHPAPSGRQRDETGGPPYGEEPCTQPRETWGPAWMLLLTSSGQMTDPFRVSVSLFSA